MDGQKALGVDARSAPVVPSAPEARVGAPNQLPVWAAVAAAAAVDPDDLPISLD